MLVINCYKLAPNFEILLQLKPKVTLAVARVVTKSTESLASE